MSPLAVLTVVLLLILWGLHVQHLNGKRAELERSLKRQKSTRKSLETSLANRARRLDVLFSAVNEVVMRVDRQGRVIAANAQTESLFNTHRMPDLPQSMLLFYRDPDWQKAFTSALKQLPEASALPDMHVSGRVLAPRLAPLGKKQALLLCVDVTEKHQAEMQRKNLFANLMHDLKTPLTSILGYARSIEAFGDDAKVRDEAAHVIADESLRANEFLDSLLTLEHVDNFKADRTARSDLWKVLNSVTHGFASQLEKKDVAIELSGDSPDVEVKVAESDLHRIIDNLIENALRYTPQGSSISVHGVSGRDSYRLEI
ncbi:MAG TPA: histidine kinase dimerization/phospho-acceptor domain-containing protein, partial [Mariprofundaceae bacterium]|nr:histidine kinase dimerization/phospho-acceptor domain-containing protein [Mariprofundaceae bacterium]